MEEAKRSCGRNPPWLTRIDRYRRLAARLAAPIVKAFVDKQRRVRNDNNYAAVDKDGHPIELTGIWSDGKGEDGVSDRLAAGSVTVAAQDPAPVPFDAKTLLATYSATAAASTPRPINHSRLH